MIRKQIRRIITTVRANDYQPLNVITLDAAAMLSNIELFEKAHPGQSIIPVLKGNAYGHGIKQVAQILDRSNCRYLAVDGYFEAKIARDYCRQTIIVMGYISPQNAHLLDLKRCEYVVQDGAGLEAFGQLNKPVKVHLELNTGMNRLGLTLDELNDYISVLKRYPKLQLTGVMTHLADADNADNSFTDSQVEYFDRAVERVLAAGLKPKLIHIAQTAGSTKVVSKYANALRIGIGIYGISPLNSTDPAQKQLKELKPVLRLTSTIIKVLELQPGDKVSYNGTFTAPKPMRIAVLPIGYYEGLPRALTNIGVVTLHGQTLPIVGRVCMNHTMIDASDAQANVGDNVTVISNDPDQQNSVAGLQSQHQIFNYNLLTGISPTVRRTII